MSVKLFDIAGPDKAIAKTFDGPGRGRKQCTSCQTYVGVRTKECVCGHSFLRKKDSPKKHAVSKRKVSSIDTPTAPTKDRLAMVVTPAGKCPIKLISTEYQEVMDWSQALKSKGYDKGEYYTVSALKYYARYFYDFFSDEYLIVEGHLDTLRRMKHESDNSGFYQKRLAARMGEVFGSIALGYQNRNK